MNKISRNKLEHSTVDTPPGLPGFADTTSAANDLTEQMRRSWSKGERTPAEIFVRRVEQSTRDEESILDLIYAEFVIREEMGETPSTVEYLTRFPKYKQRLERLFVVDRAFYDTSATKTMTKVPDESRPGTSTSQAATLPPIQPIQSVQREAIGRYLITSRLPSGGQGDVCRALHPTLGREVVIKIPKKSFVGPDHERERLLSEGKLLAELEHPYVGRIFDLDFHQGRPFLVLEYVPGRNLEQEMQQQRLAPYRAAWLLAHVAGALAHAHGKGILHRDVKPRNILIDQQGNAKLIDFGLARLQSAWSDQAEPEGAVMGSVQFMAPEQARGQNDQVGPHTDLYALGGVLYYLLTGVAPYKGKDFTATLNLAREGRIDFTLLERAPGPKALKRLCRQLLETDPAKRPASAAEVAKRLSGIAGGSGTWSPVAIALGIVLLGAVGLAWMLPQTPITAPTPIIKPQVAEKPDDGKVRLWVNVGSEGLYSDLLKEAPLRTGTLVRVRATVPAGLHAALVNFSSAGKLELLTTAGAVPEPKELAFPSDVNQGVVLEGPEGTELVLLVARKSAPITPADVEGVWGESRPWPQLPPQSILRLRLEGIEKYESKTRAFGAMQFMKNPEGEVFQRMQELRRQLRAHFDYVEGLAFAQVK